MQDIGKHIKEKGGNKMNFNTIYSMLDEYEKMLKEDSESEMGEPDETGYRDIDEDKYDEMCVNNPREDIYIQIWKDVKKLMVKEWNSVLPKDRKIEDIVKLISRIEDLERYTLQSYNAIRNSFLKEGSGYPTIYSLFELLDETPGIEFEHVYQPHWYPSDYIRITKVNGCLSEIVKFQ